MYNTGKSGELTKQANIKFTERYSNVISILINSGKYDKMQLAYMLSAIAVDKGYCDTITYTKPKTTQERFSVSLYATHISSSIDISKLKRGIIKDTKINYNTELTNSQLIKFGMTRETVIDTSIDELVEQEKDTLDDFNESPANDSVSKEEALAKLLDKMRKQSLGKANLNRKTYTINIIKSIEDKIRVFEKKARMGDKSPEPSYHYTDMEKSIGFMVDLKSEKSGSKTRPLKNITMLIIREAIDPHAILFPIRLQVGKTA